MHCHTCAVPGQRVFEVARQVGVESKTLLLYLRARGVVARSASSRLDSNLVRELLSLRDFEVKTAAIKQARTERQERARRSPSWWEDRDDDWSNQGMVWVGPEVLTGREAGHAVGVTAATIRKWVTRGHLLPVGTKGRAHLFSSRDVIAVRKLTDSRVRVPTQSATSSRRIFAIDERRGLKHANINDLVTAREAADSAGVAETTIRSWVHRGLLKPAGRRGASNLFVRLDAIKLARRPAHQPKRKPRHF